jgi:hypothetical protein
MGDEKTVRRRNGFRLLLPQKKRHSAFKNIQTKNRERKIQPLPLEFKWMIVVSPSKENRHRAFIEKKGPPPEFNPYNCAATLDHIARGVLAWISVRWYFL